MARFDDQMSEGGRLLRDLALVLFVWVPLVLIVNSIVVGTGSWPIAFAGGSVAGISLALIGALIGGDQEDDSNVSESLFGIRGLAKKYVHIVLNGLAAIFVAYFIAKEIAVENIDVIFLVGFMLGLVLASIVKSKLPLGGKA